jgi:hypothetical protein
MDDTKLNKEVEKRMGANPHEWTVKVWKENNNWKYMLYHYSTPQGTQGSCADEKTARTYADETLKDAQKGLYEPPRRR